MQGMADFGPENPTNSTFPEFPDAHFRECQGMQGMDLRGRASDIPDHPEFDVGVLGAGLRLHFDPAIRHVD